MKNVDVVCAVIIRDDKVFCCRRGPGRAMEGFWEFPGGKIEKGEHAHDALKREIREELKSDINVGLYICMAEHTYPDMPPYAGFHLRLTAYECELVSGKLELSEHTESKWLSRAEMDSVEWAKADAPIVEEIKRRLKRQKYTITMDNEDGTKEVVWTKNCSEVECRREFGRVIDRQSVSYRSGEQKKWRTIRLFNSNGVQVGQES